MSASCRFCRGLFLPVSIRDLSDFVRFASVSMICFACKLPAGGPGLSAREKANIPTRHATIAMLLSPSPRGGLLNLPPEVDQSQRLLESHTHRGSE